LKGKILLIQSYPLSIPYKYSLPLRLSCTMSFTCNVFTSFLER